MERLKKKLKSVFCLPPLPTLLLSLFGYSFVAIFSIQVPALQYASYCASAYALIITITGIPHLKKAVEAVRDWIKTHPLMAKFRSTVIGERFLADVRFRTGVMLYNGFFINLLYIAMKLISGIYYRSTWFISLAVYYTLLALMRLMLIRKVGIQNEVVEWKRYRLCGFLLLFMNQALTGIVIFMVHQNKGFDYPGLLIYAMAFYSFYAVITAVVSIIKTRRHKSPILSAAKAINLVAAMVSILSLTTAMIPAFGNGDNSEFRASMTAAVGGGVCTIVIGMAIYMIWRSAKQLKRVKGSHEYG